MPESLMAVQPPSPLVFTNRYYRSTVITQGILEEEGYRRIAAFNGRQALDVLRILPARPSVIPLDMVTLVMDGWEFRAEQQQEPVLSKSR